MITNWKQSTNSVGNFAFQCIWTIFECMEKNKKFCQLMIKIRENRWKKWDLVAQGHCKLEYTWFF